jgi:hypothetical protein
MSDKQEAIAEILELTPVVPVLIIDDVEKAISLAPPYTVNHTPAQSATLIPVSRSSL